MSSDGILQPPQPPKSPEQIAEADRQKAIRSRRTREQKNINRTNAAARNKALKRKGAQTYGFKEIQGNPDYGIGQAGPGTPYSIKTTKLPEKQTAPTKRPAAKSAGTVGKPLWPTSGNLNAMQKTDWRQAAIRRRLNNG